MQEEFENEIKLNPGLRSEKNVTNCGRVLSSLNIHESHRYVLIKQIRNRVTLRSFKC